MSKHFLISPYLFSVEHKDSTFEQFFQCASWSIVIHIAIVKVFGYSLPYTICNQNYRPLVSYFEQGSSHN